MVQCIKGWSLAIKYISIHYNIKVAIGPSGSVFIMISIAVRACIYHTQPVLVTLQYYILVAIGPSSSVFIMISIAVRACIYYTQPVLVTLQYYILKWQ